VPNHHLGLAEVCHPYHPLRGQRFPVLKTRRVAGIDTLILAHVERGSFSIAREWTDWGTPSANNSQETTAHYFDLGMLLQLTTLIDQLANSPAKKQSAKELDK
jgi:hypothetical protein